VAVRYATDSSFVFSWLSRLARVLTVFAWQQDSAIRPSIGGMLAFTSTCPPDGGELLSDVVAVDEAWFGKQRHSKRGRQTIVIGGIEGDIRYPKTVKYSRY